MVPQRSTLPSLKSGRINRKSKNIMHSDLIIQDNFLPKEEFNALREEIMGRYFPWFFTPEIAFDASLKEANCSGQLVHMIYDENVPQSPFYKSHLFLTILEQLKADVLIRIKLNLRPRLPEPYFSNFHTDILDMEEAGFANFTTSIFYINTNNGYTEFEDSTIVESVENRLVSFPLNVRHRGVSQTDTQRRIVINFNYLKLHENT
jgi:hypothetical protein